jgi:hypothetical protein
MYQSSDSGKGDSMSKTKTKGQVVETRPVEAVDLVPLQAEVQRVFEAVRDAADARLVGQLVGKMAVRRPSGRVVVNVEALAGSRQLRSSVYGHFSAKRWQDGGEEVNLLNQISISPYFLDHSASEIIGTLAHEYLHLVAEESGIQDTSRQGRFHNKAFGQLVALVPNLLAQGERSKKIGVTTEASEACRTWCAEELQPQFGNVSKLLEDAPPSKRPTTLRFECDCGTKATVSVKQANEGFAPWCAFTHEPTPMAQCQVQAPA